MRNLRKESSLFDSVSVLLNQRHEISMMDLMRVKYRTDDGWGGDTFKHNSLSLRQIRYARFGKGQGLKEIVGNIGSSHEVPRVGEGTLTPCFALRSKRRGVAGTRETCFTVYVMRNLKSF